tara:strand:- start:1503 stop:1703 length:201 start_codon:yes stop_codon:yes gene_type:complete
MYGNLIHENREAQLFSFDGKEERRMKVTHPSMRMYGNWESDKPIVPMNQANEGGGSYWRSLGRKGV